MNSHASARPIRTFRNLKEEFVKRGILLLAVVAIAALLLLNRRASTLTNTKTKNVVVIVLDGVRWQE